jgi:hypothetical protein
MAGENPDDIRMRWIAMSEEMRFDLETIGVRFLPGVFKLSEIGPRLLAEIEETGPVSMVIIDTSAAYFEGDNENDNVQMGNHARRLRALVNLPGGPTVLVCCHPIKSATEDNLLPRGGGAFLNEVDGNLTATKSGDVVTLHHGKLRGPEFAPVSFLLKTIKSNRVKDSKGRPVPTVIAKALTEGERKAAEAAVRSDEDALLAAIEQHPRSTYEGLCVALGWIGDRGAQKYKVTRASKGLLADKLIRAARKGAFEITEKGCNELQRQKHNQK